MMTQTDEIPYPAGARPRPGWLSRLGMKLMSALGGQGAGSSAHGRSKEEAGGSLDDDKCCHLALPNKECEYSGHKSDYTCPDGWNRQWWFCCEGSTQVGCGECTKSTSTCWEGPFECSIWWWTDQSC